jgi:prepilin-type N-terminal cleavage/methylation domain-containing protein
MSTAKLNLSERGFTVVELLTVLALAAIILGLALPRYSGLLSDLRLQSATAELIRDLRGAQSLAVARGPRVSVVLGERGYEIRRPGSEQRRVSLPRGITLDAVTSTRLIWFSATGASSGGFITLRGSTGATTVIVAAARGLAYAVPGAVR